MPLYGIETEDLISELLKRLGPAAYRTHKTQLDKLAFHIGVEDQARANADCR